jgi:hypothetical protein
MPKGNTRVTGKEQYYTLPEVVDQCCSIALPYLKEENLLEPAGGTGEFIEGLLRFGIHDERIYSYDIEPRHGFVEQGDFLQQKLEEQFFVISNPPFGRANSLSVKFFNHCAKNATYICFLIPKAWRKWSVVNKLDRHFHLVEDVEMPKVAFYDDNGPIGGGNLSTVFQVWEYRQELRDIIEVEDRGYLTACSPEEADVAITFFGYSSGRIETDFVREPNTTKKYFRVKDTSVIRALQSVDYSRFNRNVSYTYSLAKSEINYLLNEWYDK